MNELDAAIHAHRANPSPETLAAVLSAQRVFVNTTYRELADEYIELTTDRRPATAPDTLT